MWNSSLQGTRLGALLPCLVQGRGPLGFSYEGLSSHLNLACPNAICKGFSICSPAEILAPESRRGSAPRSPGADSDVVLLVDVLQELDVNPLVASLGISEVAQILRRKHRGATLLLRNIAYKHMNGTDIKTFVYYCAVFSCGLEGELTLLVAQNCLCPSLISGLNF